jgi:Flp pilus assembly protein TadG
MKLSSAKQGEAREYRGILTRLRRDASGNTLAMIAMATIPLAGMVGSAVDIGRSYLIKARLQQACDAGALAARRSQAGGTLDANAIDKGNKFFAINFSNNTAGATNVSFTPTNTDDGQVRGTANARVPMSITKIFGTDYIDLSITCEAKLEISNTDVVLVLDTTGSMACDPNGSNCNSGSSSKIVALREAVVDFYNTVNNATSSDARFRIGFLPYSQAVNMGVDPFTNSNLLPANWMVDTWTYQSRVANMTKLGWTPVTTFGAWTSETYGSSISNTNCTKYGNNQSFGSYNPASGTDPNTTNSNPNNAQPPSNVAYQASAPAYDQRRVYERVTGSPYSGNQSCTRRWRVASTNWDDRYYFQSWDYKPVSYNVTNYRSGNPVSVYTSNSAPTGSVENSGSYNMFDLVNSAGSTVVGSSTANDGCIEERSGNAQLNFSPIPANSYDLDILNAPTGDNATKWRPMWPELVYDRNGMNNEIGVTTNRSPTGTVCPAAASKLAVRTQSDVQDYVDGLYAQGSTYHDFGMAWGARLISPTGMWAAENTTAPNGKPISRHLIFMTDGILEPSPTAYGSQGYEESDRRVVGTSVNPTGGNGGTMAPYHNARFLALCNAARNNNVTVWTVNFSNSSQPTLVSCASDSSKAFSATNSAQLQAQFQAIASQIAELRLSK